jgi:hypothetical protein
VAREIGGRTESQGGENLKKEMVEGQKVIPGFTNYEASATLPLK